MILRLRNAAFARVKPYKVLESMIEFSKHHYHIDGLKMEVPVNMNYVEGFAGNEIMDRCGTSWRSKVEVG